MLSCLVGHWQKNNSGADEQDGHSHDQRTGKTSYRIHSHPPLSVKLKSVYKFFLVVLVPLSSNPALDEDQLAEG